jgi:hypothetical protein
MSREGKTERAIQRTFISLLRHSVHHSSNGGDVMERRDFLKLAFGFAAGAATLAASAQASNRKKCGGDVTGTIVMGAGAVVTGAGVATVGTVTAAIGETKLPHFWL